MKKIVIPAILAFMIFSCDQASENSRSGLVLTGIIENPKSKQVSLRLIDSLYKAGLDSANRFVLSLDLDTSVYATFQHGNERTALYVKSGDSLELSIDTDEFDESLVYTGTGADYNNYLAEKYLLEESFQSPFTIIQDRSQMAENVPEFRARVDSVYSAKVDLLNSYATSLDSKFTKMEKDKAFYEMANQKQNLFRSLLYMEQDSVLDDDYFSYEDQIELDLDYMSGMYQYTNFLDTYIMFRLTELGHDFEWTSNILSDYLNATDSIIQSKPIKSVLFNQSFMILGRNTSYKKVDSLFQEYKGSVTAEVRDDLQKYLDQRAQIARGKDVPDFTFYTLDDDSVKLSDFQGRIVYLDFWATWCKPCIAEHPYMEKLIDEFEGEEVEFISLSTDASPKPWKKMVNEKDLGGTHLWTEGGWRSDIMTHFVVKGIPRYVIIGKDGKIYTSYAERPSGDARAQIQKALKLTE